MIDFEDRLKDLLNQRVDDRLGPQRAPAPFRPAPGADRRPRARWLVPLVAAACVLAVALATVGLSRLANGPHVAPAQPNQHVPPPHTEQPNRHPAPSSPYRPSATPQPRSEAGTHPVRALGAVLVLPAGWQLTGRHPVGAGLGPALCIGRSGDPALRCPISLSRAHPDHTAPGYGFDVDAFELGRGNLPTLCSDGAAQVSWQGGQRALGGRSAQWRSWTYTCPGTARTVVVEQYAAITAPAFFLQLAVGVGAPFMTAPDGAQVSHRQDIAVLRGVVDTIARDSALPPQAAALPLFDRGVIRTLRRTGATTTIRLQRMTSHVVDGRTVYSAAHPDSELTYTFPAGLVDTHAPIRVGSVVRLTTDGTRTLSITAEH